MLFVFIEGDTDEQYFQNILKECLESKFGEIRYWKYADESNKKINNFIKTIESVRHYDYLFIADKDEFPCFTSCIEKKIKSIKNLDKSKVIIVEKEIESWYLAGINEDYRRNHSVDLYRNTDSLTKEQFNRLIPLRLSRIEFMFDLIEKYDLDQAIKRNASLSYFYKKYCKF